MSSAPFDESDDQAPSTQNPSCRTPNSKLSSSRCC